MINLLFTTYRGHSTARQLIRAGAGTVTSLYSISGPIFNYATKPVQEATCGKDVENKNTFVNHLPTQSSPSLPLFGYGGVRTAEQILKFFNDASQKMSLRAGEMAVLHG